MTVIKGRGKPHQVANALLAQIRDGHWKVGERLPSERELSQSLGVSRNALREALALLKTSGNISTRLGEGSFVVQPDHAALAGEAGMLAALSIADALEVRENLEVAAVSLAIHRARHADFLRISQVMEAMEEHISAQDFDSYLTSTLDLHTEIAKASHSEVLTRMVGELMDQHRRDQWVVREQYTPEIGAYSLDLHLRLGRAVIDRDYQAAVEVTCKHYENYPIAVGS